MGRGVKEEEALRRKNVVPNEIFRHYLYKFPGSPKSPPAAVPKMVKIEMKDFSDEELEKRFKALANKKNWEEECQWCELPGLLHKHPCTRSDTVNAFDYEKIKKLWKVYRDRMKPILEDMEKEKEEAI